jgi:hypothetical protein
VESRLLGFPCFPNSVISMACFGNAFHKITITAKALLGNRNHLSAMAAIRSSGLASQGPACLYGGFLQECMISRDDTGRLSQSLRREQMTMRRGAAVRFRIRNSAFTLRISTHISRPRGDPPSSHVAPEYSRRAAPLRSGLKRLQRKLVGRWA